MVVKDRYHLVFEDGHPRHAVADIKPMNGKHALTTGQIRIHGLCVERELRSIRLGRLS